MVLDTNNNPPEFLEKRGNTTEDPLVDVLETAPDISKDLATILIQDKDNPALPNGNFEVDIEVMRDPATSDDLKSLFKLELSVDGVNNIRELKVFPTKNFTGLWGNYTIKFKVCLSVISRLWGDLGLDFQVLSDELIKSFFHESLIL